MTLNSVTNELKTLKGSQDDTTEAVMAVGDLVLEQITLQKQARLDSLEDKMEGRRRASTPPPPGGKGGGADAGNGLNIPMIISRLGLASLAAIGLSLAGFDDEVKALKIPTMLKNLSKGLTTVGDSIRTTVKAIDTFVLDIKTFPFSRYIPKIAIDVPENWKLKLPDLPKITIVDSLGKAFKALTANIKLPDLPKIKLPDIPKIGLLDLAGDAIKSTWGRIKLPDLPRITFIDSFGKAISALSARNVWAKIKLPDIPKITIPEFAKITLPDIKLPDLPKIGLVSVVGRQVIKMTDAMASAWGKISLPKLPSIGLFFDGVKQTAAKLLDYGKLKLPSADNLPKFSIVIPEGLQGFFDSIKTGLGSVSAKGVGSGLIGFLKPVGNFFSGIGDLFKPVMNLLKAPIKLIAGPLLSIIDFVMGFYKGFTEKEFVEDHHGNLHEVEVSMFDKLFKGITGGIGGVIFGITDAFDALFIRLPAWILEKFGMTNAAEFLRGFSITEMVKPIWEGIVNGMKDYFGPLEDGQSRLSKIFSEAWEDIKFIFTSLFDFMPSLSDMKKKLFSFLPWYMQPSMVEESIMDQYNQKTKGMASVAGQAEALRKSVESGNQYDYNMKTGEVVLRKGEGGMPVRIGSPYSMTESIENQKLQLVATEAMMNSPLFKKYLEEQKASQALAAESFRLREANSMGAGNVVTTDMRDQSEQTVYHLNNSINNLRTAIAGAD